MHLLELVIYNEFIKNTHKIDNHNKMHIQINSFEFTAIHRLYIKILEDITSVSRTHLPKDFKRSLPKVRSSLRNVRNEKDKRAVVEGASYLEKSSIRLRGKIAKRVKGTR